MAPNNKKEEEAARLARELFRLTTEITTGESTTAETSTAESTAEENTTDAITRALREQLDRLSAEREAQDAHATRVPDNTVPFFRRPVNEAEWDDAVADTPKKPDRDR